MEFARAFSTRRKQPEMQISAPMYIGRAASQRGGRPVARIQISSPVALVSTSNSQIHHAQDIAGTSRIDLRHVSPSSIASGSSDDSDGGTGSIHSNDTITDASSVDDSPVRSEPEPNHLSCYFKPAVDTNSRPPSRSPSVSTRPSLDTPRLPQRAPSHSKRAHEGLHRKRSIQRMLSPPPSAHREAFHETARNSTEIFSPTTPAFAEAPRENPFGKELAQLDEVAEEFGQVVKSVEADADAVYMESRGLASYGASDYMSEIQSLILDMFSDEEAALQDFVFF